MKKMDKFPSKNKDKLGKPEIKKNKLKKTHQESLKIIWFCKAGK